MSRYGFSITVKLRVRAYTHGGPSLIQARATDMQRSTNTRRYFVLKEDKRRRRNPFLLETPRIRASFEVLISIEGRIHEDTFLLDVSPVSLWQVLAAQHTCRYWATLQNLSSTRFREHRIPRSRSDRLIFDERGVVITGFERNEILGFRSLYFLMDHLLFHLVGWNTKRPIYRFEKKSLNNFSS